MKNVFLDIKCFDINTSVTCTKVIPELNFPNISLFRVLNFTVGGPRLWWGKQPILRVSLLSECREDSGENTCRHTYSVLEQPTLMFFFKRKQFLVALNSVFFVYISWPHCSAMLLSQILKKCSWLWQNRLTLV